ncbi:acyltransferase [Paracoccus sp. TK19116]|uniref:Acyltransferase n=1 Tax=Paracoccus albicereus TaxID=2922394 RepID=A0ABT1MQD4_9RHOB|nr:acyltransferase [Paracoccus albicereus]MCQ0970510.1 acyltransferase [Paracoccus albicereus]
MSTSLSQRMVWFDANRVCAAAGVVLIHSTTDFAGRPFPDASISERVIPVLLRSIGEFSGSEMFFLFSLFLLAQRIDRHRPGFREQTVFQAKRLLVPFAFWTLFYGLFRLIKADVQGYAPQYLAELSQLKTWVAFFLLGKSQYHMHFLPTLFAISLFYPVMRLAMRYPMLGVLLFATLGAMNHAQGFLYSIDIAPLVRDYLVRLTKIFGYVGYGLAAFALYSLWKDGIPRGEARLIRRGALYLVLLAYLATLPFFGPALMTGAFPVRASWDYFGHFLMPLLIFCMFMGSQYASWSPRWSIAARYTFGVYLIHPAVIDLFDIAVIQSGLSQSVSPAMLVLLRFSVALPLALGLAALIGRVPHLAWTIGLGPTPWARLARRNEIKLVPTT